MSNPFTAAPARATAWATSRVRRCQRMAEHPGTLDLLSCEAKSSGDGGPGSCPHSGRVGDVVGTRWRTKQGGGSLQCGGEERQVRRWKRERWGGIGQEVRLLVEEDSTEEVEVVADVEQEQLSSQEPEEKLEEQSQERTRPGTPGDLPAHA
ncbi:hypothetical protein MJG53_020142 [Ovis ammon polii x Ovis aries]|uniref:Uncharacterized protein n=2 Tax=Ovis TaxID=9935 RepID=A0A835ZL31_SHEEP|nr:hypothetical protein JEQ12_020490 [Ovis aries]KAI4554843.1 hypothetical protein MJG53_020142 [Ovis ammon polii x Ovis aries]